MPDEASTLFDTWLDRLEAGEESDFETLLAAHPAQAEALRALHRDWQRLRGSLESALPPPLPGESFFRAPAADPVARVLLPEAGQVLGDFRLIRPLGQGGMGAVWEAEQLSLGRRVALKLLRPGRGVPRLLVREARVAGRLDHPGLVPVHAVGQADGVAFIAQQLVGDGFTLADVLDRVRRLDAPPHDWDRHVAGLLAQVAEAVHAAHEAGVLHRDLKPQNILIDDADRPRVTDFGLAHAATEDDVARPGLVGTLAYMSPEQAAGRDIEIDRRADVFSLGAVLWEALTLRRAFEGDTARAVLDKVLHEDPPDPRRIRPRVPRDLAAICGKALRKAREQRYATLAELAADLRRFLRDEPVQAEPESPLALAGKWVRRHPAWTVGLASVGLALLAISGLLLREIELRRQAQDARDESSRHAREAEEAADLASRRAAEARRQSYLANLRAADAALQQESWAEAARLLDACPDEHRGWEWAHLSLRSRASLLTLDTGGAAVRAVAMTPDGRRLVTACADGTVHAWDGTSGTRLGVLRDASGAVDCVALSDDGTRALTGGADGTLRAWDVEHGRPLLERPGHAGAILSVACDASGTLAATGGEDGTARLWRLEGGAPRVIEPMLRAAVTSVALTPDGRLLVTGTRYGAVEAWDVATGALLVRLAAYESPSVPLAVSPDGTRVATGTSDGTLRVREIADGSLRVERRAHAGAVARVAFSRDGTRLLTLSAAEGEIRAWDAADGSARGARRGHVGRLLCLAVDAAGERVVAGGAPGTAWLWRHGDGREGASLPRLAGPVLALACDRRARRVLAGTLGGPPRLVDLGGSTPPALDAVAGTPTALALDDAGVLAALASFQEPDVRLVDAGTGYMLAYLTGAQGGVTDVVLSADGGLALAASQDGRLYAWSLPGGELRATLAGHESLVSSAALSADGRRAASASADGTVRLWDVASGHGRVLSSGGWFEDALVALSADGRRVASASIHADAASVWDAETGELLCTLPGHGTGVGALALSPDGRRAFSASARERAIRVWDADTGDLLVLLGGHEAPVTALAPSGDGRSLLSGSADGDLRLWESRADG